MIKKYLIAFFIGAVVIAGWGAFMYLAILWFMKAQANFGG